MFMWFCMLSLTWKHSSVITDINGNYCLQGARGLQGVIGYPGPRGVKGDVGKRGGSGEKGDVVSYNESLNHITWWL